MILLAVLGLVGGLITGISPCVLPVLPVIFFSGGVQGASAEPLEEGRKSPNRFRPYLVILGLVISFGVFTLLGTIIIKALHLPDPILLWLGFAVLVILGIGLIVPRVQQWIERPFSWIPQRQVGTERGGLVLGLALGLVYIPCAGPVLAAISAAGAQQKITGGIVVLTIAFAIGTAIPLLVFALAGRGIASRLKAFRRHQRAFRITGGVLMIALAFAVTFNLTKPLTLVSDYTQGLENFIGGPGAVAHALSGKGAAATGTASGDASCAEGVDTLVNCGTAPPISGITSWFNTPGDKGLSLKSLRGKVVLIDFWAYSCINCQRATPHLNAWNAAYAKDGLTIIGVHSPEYAFEHDLGNVKAGAAAAGITYPVALDNDFATWTNYNNQYWPAEYLIDAKGVIRHVTFGEGDYSGTESVIRTLLTQANPSVTLPKATEVPDKTPSFAGQTPETYLDPQRAQNYGGTGSFANGTTTYTLPDNTPADTFSLKGTWSADDEGITAKSSDSTIHLNYGARHVYLDVGGTGTLTVTKGGRTRTIEISGAPNIHDLITATKPARGQLDVTLSPGLEAYSFTFG